MPNLITAKELIDLRVKHVKCVHTARNYRQDPTTDPYHRSAKVLAATVNLLLRIRFNNDWTHEQYIAVRDLLDDPKAFSSTFYQYIVNDANADEISAMSLLLRTLHAPNVKVAYYCVCSSEEWRAIKWELVKGEPHGVAHIKIADSANEVQVTLVSKSGQGYFMFKDACMVDGEGNVMHDMPHYSIIFPQSVRVIGG